MVHFKSLSNFCTFHCPDLLFQSPILQGAFWGRPASKSWQLWELAAERLELIEEILRQWGTLDIDVVIGPGFGMPAVPLGYPAYLLHTVSYTGVYNTLDFPVGSLTVSFCLCSCCIFLEIVPSQNSTCSYLNHYCL
jgi:hypothetical protein